MSIELTECDSRQPHDESWLLFASQAPVVDTFGFRHSFVLGYFVIRHFPWEVSTANQDGTGCRMRDGRSSKRAQISNLKSRIKNLNPRMKMAEPGTGFPVWLRHFRSE